MLPRIYSGSINSAGLFVWQPGGTAGAGVFTTWATLVAAVASVSGERNVIVDDSIAAATIPAGNWVFNPAGITGSVALLANPNNTFQTTITTAAAAVTLSGINVLDNISLRNESTVDLITITTGLPYFQLRGFGTVMQGAAPGGAFFKRTGGSLLFHMRDSSLVSTAGGAQEALQGINAGTAFLIRLNDAATFGANQWKLAAGTTGSVTHYGGVTSRFLAQADPVAGAITPADGRQSGSATLVAGVTANITACLRISSRIFVTVWVPRNTALSKYCIALNADRVVGPQGTFKITAILAGADTINVADTSDVHWEVIT